MAHDEALADRVRALLATRDGVTERRMFGGVAWMVAGNMACCVMRDDLVVRLEREDAERALAEPPARPFEMRGRVSRGMVVVDGNAVTDGAALAGWVDAGAAHAASLPPKDV